MVVLWCVAGEGPELLTVKILWSRLSMLVYLLRTFQVITLYFMSLNIACFVYFYRNNDGSGFVCTVMHCQGTWIWLESWYRLRPYSRWYHISILDVLYVAPFHLGCYVLCKVPLSSKKNTQKSTFVLSLSDCAFILLGVFGRVECSYFYENKK